MVYKRVSVYFHTDSDLEMAIPIGHPSKDHKFDCVLDDEKIVEECKCYTWTDTRNVPSAKVMGMNVALFYMSYLSEDTIKVLRIKKAMHSPNTRDTGGVLCPHRWASSSFTGRKSVRDR